ncbi:Flavodoxin family protein [Theileria parva strain Muguga]|uniref:Flavodoxin family protein n=1 Tax=Theileria parva strain Muguga TaxID=333668 RepID=UPI001C623E6F|nr:Flavodoxin family protein [Theileria parva strain Muguga]KAF5153086.1 Flavodoxin family protein [Theileria parva strain Muguga]
MLSEISSVVLNLGLGISTVIAHYLYNRKYYNLQTQQNNNNHTNSPREGGIELKVDEKRYKRCRIYYASQTGTSERFSRLLAEKLSQFNISHEPINLEDFEESDFYVEESVFIFLVSTHYDGLFPDNTKNFQKILRKLERNGTELRLNYCIFGLGSSDYEYFNEAAKVLQATLTQLKAHEFTPIYLCDELNGVGKEFEKWLNQLLTALSNIYHINISQDNTEPPYYKSWRHLCGLELRYENISVSNKFEVVPNDIICKQQYQCTDAKVLQNHNLIPNSDQSTHEITIDFKENYNISDTLYVLYRNPSHVVRWYMERLELTEDDLDKVITFVPRYGNVNQKLSFSPPFPIPATVKDVLELYCDLTSLPADEEILNFCTFIRDKAEIERVEQVINNSKLMKHIREEVKLTFNEFITLFFPNTKFNLAGFLQLIPKQIPKAYTIASTPNNEIKIIVKRVEYNLHSLRTFYKTNVRRLGLFNEVPRTELYKRRIYKGNCSNYLCDLKPGDTVKFFIRDSVFSNINLNRDLLLIANGTGMSGIRPIYKSVEEKGLESKVIIFLGFRTINHILYHEELEKLQNLNNFHISYALSRENDRRYVQELVKSNLREIGELVSRGGIICICGSRRMGNEIKLILKNYITNFEQIKHNQLIQELW